MAGCLGRRKNGLLTANSVWYSFSCTCCKAHQYLTATLTAKQRSRVREESYPDIWKKAESRSCLGDGGGGSTDEGEGEALHGKDKRV